MKANVLTLSLLSAGLALVTAAQAQNINGAGATFPNPIYSKWFSEYSQQNAGVKINYQAVGSGAGIRQVSEGTVDFGASDAVMTDQQISESKVKVIALPTVLGAVVPIYNVPGVSGELKFSQDAIAGIYLGKITKWNDPYIARENPGVKLPDAQIVTVHRTDASGTTYIFTDFLSKISPEWAKEVGPAAAALKWPGQGVGGKGNDGVAGLVEHQPNSIGYVELIYAAQNHIKFGSVRNSSGKFVKASTGGVTAAAANLKSMPADFRVSITNAPGADSYPISSFTWLLIPTHAADPAKGRALVGFLNWMLDKGEGEAAALTYAPLPKPVADKVRAAIKTLQ